ncbi:protocadherin-23 [Ambystoma mexicanum]|uniref:protocadherin-23 n=1 Tax=Ambystoma mexicanum TaxID=8296 RepID=UPI0037E73F9D
MRVPRSQLLPLFCFYLWATRGSWGHLYNLSLVVDEGLPEDTLVGDMRSGLPDGTSDGGGFFLSVEVAGGGEEQDSPVLSDFHVDPESGIIRTARPLDRERRERYSFYAATLQGELLQVEILVQDVNDHAPSWGGSGGMESRLRYTGGSQETKEKWGFEGGDTEENRSWRLGGLQGIGEVSSMGEVREPGQFDLRKSKNSGGNGPERELRVPGQGRHPGNIGTLRELQNPEETQATGVVKGTKQGMSQEEMLYPKDQEGALMRLEVSELTPPGTTFRMPPAQDHDTGLFGLQGYSLLRDEGGAFQLQYGGRPDGGTGTLHSPGPLDLVLMRPLDREQEERLQLLIEAYDGGSPRRSGWLQVEVLVMDANDNPPIFSQSEYQASVPESAPAGSPVCSVLATDPDQGSNGQVSYRLLEPQGGTFFWVEPHSGLVRVARPLDRESRAVHLLLVLAEDGGAEPEQSSARLTIHVLDVNDNSPLIHVSFLLHGGPAVSESALPGEYVARVSVSDPDTEAGNEEEVQWVWVSLQGGEEAFSLVPSGVPGVGVYFLRVAGPLDRETQELYHLRLLAWDSGQPPLRTEQELLLRVTDVNDQVPSFPQLHYQLSVSEAAAPGTALLTLSASDLDAEGPNSQVQYRLLPGMHGKWHRDGNNGGRILGESGIVSVGDSGSPNMRESVKPIKGDSKFSRMKDLGVTNQWNAEVLSMGISIVPNLGGPALPTATDPNVSWKRESDDLTMVKSKMFSVRGSELPSMPDPGGSRMQTSVVPSKSGSGIRSVEDPGIISAEDSGVSTFGRPQVTGFSEGYSGSPSAGDWAWFHLDPETGVLSTALTLDREQRSVLELWVEATDLGRPALSSSCAITVQVEDANDNEPIFEEPLYSAFLPEHAPLGHCFLKVKATDADIGPFGAVQYFLYDGFPNYEESHLFSIDPDAGHVCVSKDIDREDSPSSYDLLVKGKDGGGLSGQAFVHIEIEDINDNSPDFEPSAYVTSMSSHTQPGTELLNVIATDQDSGTYGRVTYQLMPGELSAMFSVDSSTGIIYLAEALNHLEVPSVSLAVSARDGGGLTSLQNASVTLNILHTALAPAIFEQSRYTFSVLEDAPVGSTVGTVRARDPLNSTEPVSYKITSGDPLTVFSIDHQFGVIRTKKQLDHELHPVVILTVQSQLGSSPVYSSTQANITVTDVNDNHPLFPKASERLTICQSTAPGTAVFIAQAEDRDGGLNGVIRYSLAGERQTMFFIDPDLGVVYLNGSLPSHLPTFEHNLQIKATDSGTPQLSSLFNLTIIAEKQEMSSALVFDNLVYQIEVSESFSLGARLHQVRAHILGSRTNASNIRYSLETSGNSAVFGIYPGTGWLFLRRPLDYEATQMYNIKVLARCKEISTGPDAATTVRVKVQDENDHSPAFTHSAYFFNIAESPLPHGVVGRITAIDKDGGRNGQLSYSLLSGGSCFRINSKTGEIINWVSLDREQRTYYQLAVLVTDHGAPRRNATTTVHILITDINDNEPYFPQLPPGKEFNIKVLESQPESTLVSTVYAKDPDSGKNGTLIYSLSSEDSSRHFKIDENSGELRTAVALSSSGQRYYRLVVTATDEGTPALQANAVINIEVIPVPRMKSHIQGIKHIVVPEDVEPAQVICSLKPLENPLFNRKNVHFRIAAEDKDSHFEIESSTGEVFLAQALNYETASHYLFRVALESQNEDLPANSSIILSIDVGDKNDNAPSFEDDLIIIGIEENVAVGTVVYMFNAKDGDGSLVNSQLKYSLHTNAPTGNPFLIDPWHGTLTTAAPLDRELSPFLVLTVLASDQPEAMSDRKQGSMTAKIVILDINDNPPEFVSATSAHIMEDAEVGALVHRVIAIDPDEARNGEVAYAILSGNENNTFLLDASTGLLTLASTLDHEVEKYYRLSVLASDKGFPVLSSTQTLSITVTDANDVTPRFKQQLYEATVSENRDPGEFVIKVEAVDADSGINSLLSFEILPGIGYELFSIDSATGEVITTCKLDRESQQLFTIQVLVKDGGSPSLSSTTTILCTVLDENDNAPKLLLPFAAVHIWESQEPGAVFTAVAIDLDAGSNGTVQYRIVGGNTGNHFAINNTSGELWATHGVDREEVSNFSLTIECYDLGTPQKAMEAWVNIVVLDENDNPPKFTKDLYCTSVREDLAAGSLVIELLASDDDEGLNGQVTYSLDSGGLGVFNVNRTTGTIVTTRALDRETAQEYHFGAVASDSSIASSRRSTTVNVVVQVQDMNDNSPHFTENPTTAHVSTQTPVNRTIATVGAVDADQGFNGTVEFSFVEDEPDFHINRQTGEVQLQRALGSDPLRTKVLKVLAADQGVPARTATGLVVIEMPGKEGGITFTQSLYEAFLPENSEAGASVVTVGAWDRSQPGEKLQYRVVSSDEGAAFAINHDTGELMVEEPKLLDFEAQEKFHLVVLAESRQNTAYCKVSVLIQDVNDNSPQFVQQEPTTSVPEGQIHNTHVMQVFAIDADSGLNGEIEYSIINGNENKALKINASTGILETNAILDREIISSYRLILQAADKGTPRRSATSVVAIEVLDINDNAPTIPPLGAVTVSESAPLGYLVAQLSANDVDLSPTISYRFIDNGNPETKFAVDQYTGVITLVERLDFEEAAEHHLWVQASDSLHQTEAELTIWVSDVNDNAPIFTQDSYQVQLQELTPVHTSVLPVSATDRDSEQNGVISYRILSPPRGFAINPIDGLVFTDQQISSEENSTVIQLLVEAKDHGSPALSTVVSVGIQIQDINNHAPFFTNAPYSVAVSEDISVGTTMLTFSAVDHDWSHDNSYIDYILISGNTQNTFLVETCTVQSVSPHKAVGHLVLGSNLDRERISAYRLVILATDRGTPPLNSTTTVFLSVLDANDSPPVFTSEKYYIEVRESTPVGSLVAVISANDCDVGDNADIHYSIVSGNDLGQFRLDKQTGLVELAKTLDYENVLHYTLIIQASDRRNGESNVAFSALSITVLDDNDFAPMFLFVNINCNICENLPALTQVCTVKALDFDAGPYGVLSYSIQSTCFAHDSTSYVMDMFYIEPLTGEIHTKQTLDYEHQSKYCLIAQAKDISGSTASVTVHVDVVGVDEYDPVFLRNLYFFDLPEKNDVGQVVGKLAAMDNDDGLDGVIEFSLENASQFFSVNRTSGEVSLTRPFFQTQSSSRKKDSTMELWVKAHSPKLDSRSSRCIVIVNISTSLEMYSRAPVNSLYISLIIALVVFLLLFFSLAVIVLRYKRKHVKNTCGNKGMSISNPNPGPNDHQLYHSGEKSSAPQASITEWLCLVDIREKKDGGKQCRHSDSSGHGSADGELAEDEEIKRINEQPSREDSGTKLSERGSRVPESGIPRGSAQLSIQSMETDVTFVTESADSIHNFKVEGRGEFGDIQFTPQKVSPKAQNVGLTEGDMMAGITGSYIFVPHSQDSRFGSLASLVASDEDLRGSYNWDYMLSWEPRFQPLSSVFQDIAKLNDESSQVQSMPDEKQALIFPPPLITSVAQPGIRAVPTRMATVNAGQPSFKYSCSPFIHNIRCPPTVMTPSFSPSLSLLTMPNPTASPVGSDTTGPMGTCLVGLSHDLTSEEDIKA